MRSFCLLGFLLIVCTPARGDEGMWLFNKPPVRQVQERHGFTITPEWLEHLQKSSVRSGSGGSASFASARGLVLTNHHVGAGAIEKLSTPERNLVRDGFYAEKESDELKCSGLEMNVLMDIKDVTGKVLAAAKSGQSREDAAVARRTAIAGIENEATASSGLRCEVVTLYQGGAFHLYSYQRFTDVRLVFAPDAQAAAFGGDPDNFEFPRHCLDFCFFRVYQNGKPASTPHFLKWNAMGAAEGELVFTSGHPGRTSRGLTMAQLKAMRDHGFPNRMEQVYRSETLLRAWSDRGVENARRAKGSIIGTQNGRKAIQARLNGLLDPALIGLKVKQEADLRERLRDNEKWKAADAAFDRIEKAKQEELGFDTRYRFLEGGEGFSSSLFDIARTLLRAADEAGKPEKDRLRGFHEAARVSLELDLFSEEPIYEDMEILRLQNSLSSMCAKLGAGDPLVSAILAGKPPSERAAELVHGSSLGDVSVRRNLYDGGKNAVDASADPFIQLARLVDAESRSLRAKAEAVSEVISQAHQEISQARFELEGDSTYPDATFSLRLSSGVIKGYHDGVAVPAMTDFNSMSQRHEQMGGAAPYDLSEQWIDRAGELDPKVPLNFVSTNDITGGNSGSPLVNRAGELVGLVFDTNAPGLISDFAYTEEKGRAVSVHPAAILECLRVVYRADRVLGELGF